LKERKDKFAGLIVKNVRGADPVIRLLDENKVVREELGIDKWTTDTVEQFLNERLKQ